MLCYLLQLHYEREAEAKSETESAVYEMSRQASHTESCDGQSEAQLSDQVMEELLQVNGCWQSAENVCSLKQEEASRSGWVNNHAEPDILKNCSSTREEGVTLDKCSFPSLLETVADSFKSSRGPLFKRPASMFLGEEMDSFNGVTDVVHRHLAGSPDCVATSFSKAAWDSTPQGILLDHRISTVPVVNGVSKCDDVIELGNGCPTVQWQEVAQDISDKGSACHEEDAVILTGNDSNSGGINRSQMGFCNNSETYCNIPIATVSHPSDFNDIVLDGAEVASELGKESEICVALNSLHLKGDGMVRKEANFTDRGNKNKDGGILI